MHDRLYYLSKPMRENGSPAQVRDVADVIDAFELDFYRGNALKYLIRAGRKSSDRRSDLLKCRDYIQHMIDETHD